MSEGGAATAINLPVGGALMDFFTFLNFYPISSKMPTNKTWCEWGVNSMDVGQNSFLVHIFLLPVNISHLGCATFYSALGLSNKNFSYNTFKQVSMKNKISVFPNCSLPKHVILISVLILENGKITKNPFHILNSIMFVI